MQAEIDELQDKNLLRRTTPDTGMTMGEATCRLENAHRHGKLLNAAQEAALQRLQGLEQAEKYGPDIVFKVFNDLDTLLFQGVLKGNVRLGWVSDDVFARGGSSLSSGRTWPPETLAKRVGIELNEDILQLSTTRLRDMISTFVHECVVSIRILSLVYLTMTVFYGGEKLEADTYLACIFPSHSRRSS